MNEYPTFERISSFVEELKSNKHIVIEEDNTQLCREDLEFIDIDYMLNNVNRNKNMQIDIDDLHYSYLTGLILDWEYSKGQEWIYGGYKFNLFNCLASPSHFWKIYNAPPNSKEQENFLNDLVYFQKSGHGDDGTFGCFYREGKYPCDIYFYDAGVYWKMNISLDDYFEKMLKYKAVAAWQYFFIDAKDIIKKLDGLTCENWPVATVDRIDSLPKAKGVLHQMDKIIRLFPILFPDVDLFEVKVSRDQLYTLLN